MASDIDKLIDIVGSNPSASVPGLAFPLDDTLEYVHAKEGFIRAMERKAGIA